MVALKTFALFFLPILAMAAPAFTDAGEDYAAIEARKDQSTKQCSCRPRDASYHVI